MAQLTDTNGPDRLRGTEIDDTISGSAGQDTLIGSGGDDMIFDTGGDDDVLFGGEGDDYLYDSGGDDLLNGGSNRAVGDHVDYGLAPAGVRVDLRIGDAQRTGGGGMDQLVGIENLGGSSHDDRLTGSGRNNAIDGQYGDDKIFGGRGDDTLAGGDGADVLVGGAGRDMLIGHGDPDRFVYAATSDSPATGSGDFLDLEFHDYIDLRKLAVVSIVARYREDLDMTAFEIEVSGDLDMRLSTSGDLRGFDNFLI